MKIKYNGGLTDNSVINQSINQPANKQVNEII